MIELGTILGGKYRIDQILGRGGMGVVAAATHVQLGTPVALKFLRDQLAESQHIAERFMREARAAAKLKGEHVCRVFDVCMLDGMPCLVMERLDGIDLAKLLRRDGPMPVELACDYMLQACAGMAEAHTAQIIHRDLKPGNMFVTTRTDGTPLIKILDFGVAKAIADVSHDLTHSDVILGSPSYMSPEQIQASKLADARSDIWSLGVILYELVAGKKPFSGQGIANLALTIATAPAPALPRGPVQLDAVIARCLDKDPNRRFQNVAELAAALAPFANPANRTIASSIERVVRNVGRASGSAIAWSPEVASEPSLYTLNTDPVAQQLSTIRSASGVVTPVPDAPRKRRGRLVAVLAVLAAFGAVGVVIGMKLSGEPANRSAAGAQLAPTAPQVVTPSAPVVAPVDAAVETAVTPDAATRDQPAVASEPIRVDAGVPARAKVKRVPPPTSKKRDVRESRI